MECAELAHDDEDEDEEEGEDEKSSARDLPVRVELATSDRDVILCIPTEYYEYLHHKRRQNVGRVRTVSN